MRCIDPGNDWQTWKETARGLLRTQVHPSQVRWTREQTSYLNLDDWSSGTHPSGDLSLTGIRSPAEIRVPKAFLELAEQVICNADLSRWDLLYRMLWRIVLNAEHHLLEIRSDDDVLKATRLAKAVSREVHKMHAFVRFRKVGETEEGREYYVAWFEPEHWIIERGCDLFKKRYANMDWSIYSPRGCAHWIDGQFSMTDPVATDPTQTLDSMEDLWRTYYRSIFNPARLKLKAMQSEMPKKYWKNLPEAELFNELTDQSQDRVHQMLETTPRPAKPLPNNKYLQSLYEMSKHSRKDDNSKGSGAT